MKTHAELDSKMIAFSIRLPAGLHRQLKKYASLKKRSMNQTVNIIIEEMINQKYLVTFTEAVEFKSETGKVYFEVYPVRDGKLLTAGIKKCTGKTPAEALANARQAVIEAGYEIGD
jgi:hypothetical protein